MSNITNPILPGFNPDPSIIRVGEDYYIATSTFEWFPGVQIHHSTDLVNWELIAHPLQRTSQLDMYGTDDSCGIWAPCLTYDDGVFYLIYTNVRNNRRMKDAPNYLVTTTDIRGEWSEPIYLNRSGFDPSLFHDDDGKKWLVNMKWDTKHGENPFAGILLQEYDPELKKLVGPIKNIFRGSSIALTEGPHLYKRNGYYYLLVAEGGTGYNHAVTIARSKDIDGSYEIHPANPILTGDLSKMHTTLQKAGHADLVDTPDGEWYMVHLTSRPLPNSDRCNLGRETAIQKMVWKEDDWVYMANGSRHPETIVEGPRSSKPTPKRQTSFVDNFDNPELNINWNTLRIPVSDEILSLTANPGKLRLYGQEALESAFKQSLLARRQQSFNFEASTKLIFKPETSLHMAGLVYYYNTSNYYYLRVTFDEDLGKYALGILSSQNEDYEASMLHSDNIFFDAFEEIEMKIVVRGNEGQFYYKTEGDYIAIGNPVDASTLSDDFAFLKRHAFTGAFVGVCCQDLSYGGHPADFDYFTYKEL